MINANNFPEVYENLGIDIDNLGCIMLDIEPLMVSDIIAEDDLYYSSQMGYVKGIVSEAKPHVTLLYGLMHPGPRIRKHVDAVLDGWKVEEVEIGEVSYFESYSEDDPYYCLVGKLVVTPMLLEGNGRLRFLPHIDTYMDYQPHITLAYIKKDETKLTEYLEKLNERFALEKIKVVGLNYGS